MNSAEKLLSAITDECIATQERIGLVRRAVLIECDYLLKVMPEHRENVDLIRRLVEAL